MKNNPDGSARFPIGIFSWVFVFVFTLVFGISVVATSIAPKSFASTARVEVSYGPADGRPPRSEQKSYDATLARTESAVVNSEAVLRKVVGELNLNEVWGKKYFNGETLKTWETLKILMGRTVIRPVPDTALIEIRTFDDNPHDAAATANGIAQAYSGYVATNSNALRAEIIDSAYPNEIPVRPNTVLNYFWGILVGIILGSLAGAGIALFVIQKNRAAAEIPAR
jgi:uncharacterized protein involved in exopolysaccharide biosynthesis